MEYLVIAEIEIDGTKIEHYTNITLRQSFNAHHEFIIRISHDVVEDSGSFSLENAQKKIGKSAIIRLQKKELSLETAYEFRGIICEVRIEQSGNLDPDLVIIGYSPTILLDSGQHFSSFYETDLKKIIQTVTKPLEHVNCNVNIECHYESTIKYICQYRESGFHFINRLSADFSEFFYYDGANLNFGKPATAINIDVIYGEDISSMQMTLQALPMKFSNYSYNSKEDKIEKCDSPSNVTGLGQYSSYIVKESDNIFSEPVISPLNQRIENKSELENFVKKQKASIAANLEILTGTSYNPKICLGSIIHVKISKLKDNSFVKEDYGKFLVTNIEHSVDENGKYYNSFQCIPSALEVIPVSNITNPVAEPQIAIVKHNDDPEKMGRVRVQMLWQTGSQMTDWIRVMTPDAGTGKGNAKNRGLVTIPEISDQVLICFRYHDPDRPFVMGSLFNGKTGEGGGDSNKTKSLIALSGSKLSMDGKAITIVDADEKSKLFFDGDGKIELTSSESIKVTCGESSIVMKKDGTIEITGKKITVNATDKAELVSGQAAFTADGQANEAKMEGVNSTVKGSAEATVNGGAKTEVSASGNLTLKGAIIALN